MIKGPSSATHQMPVTRNYTSDQGAEKLAGEVRCPGMSMLIREGMEVDKDGYVSFGEISDKMQEQLGYSEGFSKFLLGVFGTTSATSVGGFGENIREKRINVWDLSNAKSGGQHVKSLPFRDEQGQVDLATMNEAIDRFAPDGKVTLEAVGKMINAYGQSGIVTGEEEGGGLKGRLGALGEQQTAGEVMLLFSAFAKRDGDGNVYMDKQSFVEAYQGKIPSGFMQSRDNLGLGTVPQWTGLTAKTGAAVAKDDVKTGWQSLKSGISGLFRSEDAVIEGADRALGRDAEMGADQAMFAGVAKSGICPAMPGAAGDEAVSMVRNPAEAAALHQDKF